MSQKNIEAFLGRNYPVTLYRDEQGGFVAEHRDLPGCITQGETAEETLQNLDEARRVWIESALEHNDQVPLPSTDHSFGGKVLVRMPKSLHRQLVEAAEREAVSLNSFVVSLLSARHAEWSAHTSLREVCQDLRKTADLIQRSAVEAAPVQGSWKPEDTAAVLHRLLSLFESHAESTPYAWSFGGEERETRRRHRGAKRAVEGTNR